MATKRISKITRTNSRISAKSSSNQRVTYNIIGDITTAPIKTIGYWISSMNTVLLDIAIAGDGALHSAGYSGGNQLHVKLNPDGSVAWQKQLTNTAIEIWGVTVDSSGNHIGLGFGPAGQGNNDIFLVKYNSEGTLQWQKSLGNANNQYGYKGVVTDSNNSIYITGGVNYGAGVNAGFIAKYYSNGQIDWQRALYANSTASSELFGLAIDNNGDLYSTSSTREGGALTTLNNIRVVKYNNSGSLLWQRVLVGNENENGYGIATDSNNNVYVASHNGGTRLHLAKFNTSGTLQWQKAYNEGVSIIWNATTDNYGNVYVVGALSTGNNNALILKYNSSGSLLWQKSISGPNTEYAYSITTDNSNNMYILGWTGFTTNVPNIGNRASFVLKLPNDGTKTGSYATLVGNIVYGNLSFSSSDASLSVVSGTATNINTNYSSVNTTLISIDSTFPSQVITIP